MFATICLVPFNNPESFLRVMKQLSLCKTNDCEILVIDNSTNDSEAKKIQSFCDKVTYIKGDNKSLAHANNSAISMAQGKYFIYLCSNHTWIYDNNFVYRIAVGIEESDADMAGTISYEVSKHVQGGVYIAKTESLRDHYYDELHYEFNFMDVDICQRMIATGKRLADIPSIFSTMKDIRIETHELWQKTKEVAVAHSHFYERLDK